MKRTKEFVLGLIGGIFGIIGSLMAMFIGGAATAFGSSHGSTITGSAIIALILSILGIIGSVIATNKTTLAGIFLIAAAIIGFICIFMFYILPGILLLIAGLMCFLRKNNSSAIQ